MGFYSRSRGSILVTTTPIFQHTLNDHSFIILMIFREYLNFCEGYGYSNPMIVTAEVSFKSDQNSKLKCESIKTPR